MHFELKRIIDMKKALFFALLVSCIGLAQGQQILSFSYNDTPVAEGDTLTLKAASNNELQFAPKIRNDELFNLVCIIECSKLNNTSSEIVSVCTGVICKDGYISAPFDLAGNTTYNEAHIEFDVPADAPMGLFKIRVYDTAAPSTEATMYVKVYNKNSNVGIANASNITLAAYPNPATSEVTVSYDLKESNSSLVLYTVACKLVREIALNASEGSTRIDVSTLPSGIYMYGIKNSNGISGIKKLVVK